MENAENIKKLKDELNNIISSLKTLKDNIYLSTFEKEDKAKTLLKQAEDIKIKIHSKLDMLKNNTDEKAELAKKNAEELLKEYDQVINLYNSILNSQNIKSTEQNLQTSTIKTWQTTKKEKTIFAKLWDWIWNQWNNIQNKEKRKKEPWKNLLRTTWFITTWVWAITLLWKWFKSIWNHIFSNKDKNVDEYNEKKDNWYIQDKWYWKLLKWISITALAGWWIYLLDKRLNLWWNSKSSTNGKEEKTQTETKIESTNKNEEKNKEEKRQTNNSLHNTWENQIQNATKQKNNTNKEKSLQYNNSWYTAGENLTQKQQNAMKQKLNKVGSPITVTMVQDSCTTHNVPVEYLLGFMQNDSGLWTKGKWARTHNPGNVWNTDSWGTKDFWTREKWVDACAENLEKRINAYSKVRNQHNWKWFNNFPTPKELATWKSEGWIKFFGVYMTSKTWPTNVTKIIDSRADCLS